jgi:hypothetical protein
MHVASKLMHSRVLEHGIVGQRYVRMQPRVQGAHELEDVEGVETYLTKGGRVIKERSRVFCRAILPCVWLLIGYGRSVRMQ